jgi:hypothetical protein
MSRCLANVISRGMIMAIGVAFMLASRPASLNAQQSASVLVRVNVINVPVAPAAFDSITRTMRDTVSADTRARAMAHARERGLRVAITRAAADSQPAAPAALAPQRETDVLLMEYVAN